MPPVSKAKDVMTDVIKAQTTAIEDVLAKAKAVGIWERVDDETDVLYSCGVLVVGDSIFRRVDAGTKAIAPTAVLVTRSRKRFVFNFCSIRI